MKFLFVLIVTMILFSSCENQYISDGDFQKHPYSVKAEYYVFNDIDTSTTYYLNTNDNEVFLHNTKTLEPDVYFKDETGDTYEFMILVGVVGFIIGFILGPGLYED